jgi:imidazolonepropionase-like amidohydrolase
MAPFDGFTVKMIRWVYKGSKGPIGVKLLGSPMYNSHRVVACRLVSTFLPAPPLQEQNYSMTIRGGSVVLDGGHIVNADIGVGLDGMIATISPPGSLAPAIASEKDGSGHIVDINATGLVVMPGGIDSHCHIEQKTSVSDLESAV